MTVDVIIPVRAPAPWLHEALESAVGQSGLGRIVVAMDRCSRDDLPGPRTESARLAIEWVLSAGDGPSAARNAGVAASCSPQVVFLDADDRLEPGALPALLAGVDDRHEIVVGRWRHIGAAGEPLSGGMPVDPYDSVDALRWMCEVTPPTGPVLLPRTAIAWDETRSVWEVSRYFHRVAAGCRGLRTVPSCVAAIRQHDDGARSSIVQRHFAPDVVLAFWLEEYAWARELGARGAAARATIAARLLASAYASARMAPTGAAEDRVFAFARQDGWDRLLAPRPGSAAWVALRFGGWGLRWFHRVNALLGR